jgi:hypothetical protein
VNLGGALCKPRNFRAKKPHSSGGRDSRCYRAKAKYVVQTLVLIQEELTKEEK